MKRTFTVCLLVILINFKGWSQVSVSEASDLAVNCASLSNAGGLLAAINGRAQTWNVEVIISGDLTTEAGVAALNASNFTTTAEESAVSTSGPNIGFFHFKPGVAIQTESGAAAISGSPNDFKSDVTHPTTRVIGAGAFTGIIGCTGPTWTGSISTDWNVADNWCNGLVPDATAAVMIPINSSGIYPIISLADAVAASVTINGGASLTMSGAYNLTLSSAAGFTNNGTFTGAASTGAVIFAGTGTVGGAVNFKNVTINGAVDFGIASTVNGNLTINAGGAAGGIFGTSLINYGAASTLIYNTTLVAGNEWYKGGSGTIIPGAGIPQNVTILSGTITIPNSGGANRALAGNLIINSGSTLQMTAGTSRDIYIAGNWTNNGGSFTANGRTVSFDGTTPQSIFGTTTFFNITLQNPVSFGSSVTTIANTLSNSSPGGIMDGGTSTVILTGIAGSMIGNASKNFYNLQINNSATITHTTGPSNIHVDNSFVNNGSFTENAGYTFYFDKSNATETLSGSGATLFGSLTVGGAGYSFPTTLNTGSSDFTLSGAALSFNSNGSKLTSSTGTVTFALNSAGTCTVKNASGVTGTSASFYNVLINPPVVGVATALDFGINISTINNGLTINNNGSVITNAPSYGNSASLIYNTTTPAYLTGLEWSVNSTTPGAGVPKNVTIQNTNNVLLAGDRGINGNLTIASTDTLKLNDHTLTLNGSISNTGFLAGSSLSGLVIGANVGTVYFSAGGKSNVLQILIVNSGASATVGNALNIVAGSTSGILTANGTLNANGKLTLLSDINGISRVAASSGAINGDVTVERYIATGPGSAPNHGKSWQLLAIPTTGQSIKNSWQEGATAITGTLAGNPNPGYGTMITSDLPNALVLGFDAYTSPGPSMKYYNPVTKLYNSPPGTGASIYDQRGYFVFVRGDRSVYTSNGTANPTILRTKGTLFTAANFPPTTWLALNEFASVGNPYASPIDFRLISKPGLADVFQVWDPRLGGGYNYGAFQTITKNKTTGNYTVTPGGGSYGLPGSVHNYIESGQAFFVQTIVGSTGSISFTEGVKANVGSSLFTTPAHAPELEVSLRTSLYSTTATHDIIDGVLNDFGESFTNGIDGMDARKNINTGENLSIKTGDRLLAVERRRMVSEQDTIFLILTGGVRPQPYRYEFIAQNMNVGALQGFLEDTYLHVRTPIDLNGTTLIDFTIEDVSESYAPDRFRVVFTEAASGPLPLTFTSVKASRQGTMINVEWKVENERNIKEYEVEKSAEGLHFKTMVTKAATGNRGNSASYLAADVQPVKDYNYYRIRCNDKDGKSQVSKVVRVFAGTINQDINIYPNPITDGMIQLQFMNEPEGKYGLRLLNKIGQVILSKQVTLMDGSSTELIKWNFNLAHGMYQLEITKPDGKIKNINVMY